MWSPLCSASNTELIEKKIDEICFCLDSLDLEKHTLGLMGGVAGKALFYSYYGRFKNKNSYIEKSSDLLYNILKQINQFQKETREPINPLFSSGLAGVFWAIGNLTAKGMFSQNYRCSFEEADEYLSNSAMFMLREKNVDFLHGSVGIAYYLLSRYKSNRLFHDNFISNLKSISISGDDGHWTTWKTRVQNFQKEYEMVYNLSLSHGTAAIIAYLNKYIQFYGHSNSEAVSLLRTTINYTLKQKLDVNLSRSFFPNWISENGSNTSSGVRWCYGDLGISYSLYESARLLSDEGLRKLSLEILLHTCTRRNPNEEKVIDSALCHGAFGVSHIYNRLYHKIGNENFRDTAEHWLEVGIGYENANEPAGWISYKGDEGWHKDFSLLEGLAGIGLVLISSTSKIEPCWDEALLLS